MSPQSVKKGSDVKLEGWKVLSTAAEHTRVSLEEYQGGFLKLPGSERYAACKALYRPGTLVAYPLLEDKGAEPDQWAVALVRACNWIGNMHWFMFRSVFCGLPSLEVAASVARPDRLWWWQMSGDNYLHTDLWHVLGDLPGWDPLEWPEVTGWTEMVEVWFAAAGNFEAFTRRPIECLPT